MNAVDLGTAVRGDVAATPAPMVASAAVHQVVQAAMDATDRIAHGAQHAVNLRFDIDGNALTVRVELRGDTVHTTFRTDSAELRTTLSAEWQAVTGSVTPERAGRLAPPEFTSNDQGGDPSPGDRGARHSDQPPDRPEPSLPRFPVPHSGERRGAGLAVNLPNPPRSGSANSIHLHTLA